MLTLGKKGRQLPSTGDTCILRVFCHKYARTHTHFHFSPCKSFGLAIMFLPSPFAKVAFLIFFNMHEHVASFTY